MKLQKRLAAQVLGGSPKRIVFDETRLEEIKEAITSADIRKLIGSGAIIQIPKRGISRSRANKTRGQKAKGRQTGHGSRKGVASARGENKKRRWINKVRLQRRYVMALKKTSTVDNVMYRDLYRKIKGGFFRSKRHIQLFLEEKNILKAKQ